MTKPDHAIGLTSICTELRGAGYTEAAEKLANQANKIDALEEEIKDLEADNSRLGTIIESMQEGKPSVCYNRR